MEINWKYVSLVYINITTKTRIDASIEIAFSLSLSLYLFLFLYYQFYWILLVYWSIAVNKNSCFSTFWMSRSCEYFNFKVKGWIWALRNLLLWHRMSYCARAFNSIYINKKNKQISFDFFFSLIVQWPANN